MWIVKLFFAKIVQIRVYETKYNDLRPYNSTNEGGLGKNCEVVMKKLQAAFWRIEDSDRVFTRLFG